MWTAPDPATGQRGPQGLYGEAAGPGWPLVGVRRSGRAQGSPEGGLGASERGLLLVTPPLFSSLRARVACSLRGRAREPRAFPAGAGPALVPLPQSVRTEAGPPAPALGGRGAVPARAQEGHRHLPGQSHAPPATSCPSILGHPPPRNAPSHEGTPSQGANVQDKPLSSTRHFACDYLVLPLWLVGDWLPQVSCMSYFSPDCPCLSSSPTQAFLPAPQLQGWSFLSPLNLQNIVLYEWLPSFLQKMPPEYAGEGMGRWESFRDEVGWGEVG